MNNYSSCSIPQINESYTSLLDDNIEYLLTFIYNNKNKEPYNNIEVRVALSLQLVITSKKLISPDLTSKIVSDIDILILDGAYLNKYADREQKKKMLLKEKHYVLKHTVIDDKISLNIFNDEISSSISTLQKGAKPSNTQDTLTNSLGDNQEGGCNVM